jgi:hypothetical protein
LLAKLPVNPHSVAAQGLHDLEVLHLQTRRGKSKAAERTQMNRKRVQERGVISAERDSESCENVNADHDKVIKVK